MIRTIRKFRTVALLSLLLAGCVQPVGPIVDPTPGPTADAEATAHNAVVTYARLMADVYDKAATKAAGGGTDREVSDVFDEGTAARKAAFAPVDKIIQERHGGDKWGTKAADTFHEIASGLRGVK